LVVERSDSVGDVRELSRVERRRPAREEVQRLSAQLGRPRKTSTTVRASALLGSVPATGSTLVWWNWRPDRRHDSALDQPPAIN
jgi:hypothetical protein